jgi:hypothetical protein
VKRDEHKATVLAGLRDSCGTEPDERLRNSFLRFIADPLKPRGDKGKLRINPILILLAAMFVLAGGTFLFFSLLRP